MTVFTVDAEIRDRLAAITEPVELRSVDGAILGYFTPLTEEAARRYEAARSKFDPEVIRRRSADAGPWLTTGEVVRHIESQGTAE